MKKAKKVRAARAESKAPARRLTKNDLDARRRSKKVRAARAEGKAPARRLTKNDLDARIQFVEKNPKRPGSESHRRYALYCQATTIREASYLGAEKQDLKMDEKAGFMTRAKGPPRQQAPTEVHI